MGKSFGYFIGIYTCVCMCIYIYLDLDIDRCISFLLGGDCTSIYLYVSIYIFYNYIYL